MRSLLLVVVPLAALLAAGSAAASSRPSPVARAIAPVDAAGAFGAADTILFDNNADDAGLGISSQNFERRYDAYDDLAADDFTVPPRTTWTVDEVDVTGDYARGHARGVSVTFYSDAGGIPGATVQAYVDLAVPHTRGSFAILLPSPATLSGGRRGTTYWLSVQARQNFSRSGQWYWETSTDSIGYPDVWENPGGGFGVGCTAWTPESTCFPGEGPSQMFALLGSAATT